MKIIMLLILSLLDFSISQGTVNNIFTNEDNFKIISVSKIECLGKKIQFTVEFEEHNLIVPSLEFKLNLQSKSNLDTFFANCIFEVSENSQQVPAQVNDENNKEKNKFNSAKNNQIKKSQKIKPNTKAICTYDSLYKQGIYILKTNPENNNVIIEKEVELELIPCDFRKTKLFFRQANSFKYAKESKSLSFFSSGLSSGTINAEEIISIWILLYIRGQKELEPVEAKCSLLGYSAIEENKGDFGIKPVVFSCYYTFNGEGDLEEPYMRLYRSEYLSGFPTEPELLHPFLTDLFIKNGTLPNFSEPSVFEIVPAIIKEPKYDFDNFSEKGTLKITAEVTGNFEVGTSFNIPLINPPRCNLICEISSYKNSLVSINCSMEDELDNEYIILETIIVKEKKKELFVLPGMKSGKLSTKLMRGIIVKEKLDYEDNNLKNDKQLSDLTFHIYEDTYKCVDDSEDKTFEIHGNEEKEYIFVSISNLNIKFYSKYGNENSKNYLAWNPPHYGGCYIFSKGAGCFQVHYLKINYFEVNRDNKLFTQSFNILNEETVQFQIYNSLDNSYSDGKDSKMTIYLYSSENNFVKELKIDRKYQELEIDKKKDQYYYKIGYTQKASRYNNQLNITFNLNNNNYIAITIKIKLYYISPIAYMCITLGSVAMIPVLLFIIKYIVKYCQEKKRKREELNELLNKRIEEELDYEINKEKINRRIKKKKEEEIRQQRQQRQEEIRQQRQEKIKKEVNQVVQRASFLYDCIQKDYTLINEACLLCAKCDKIPSLMELNDEYEDNEEEEEDDDDDDYKNNNIFNNYGDNKTINVITDINKGKYNSFMEYISPIYCDHFYHESCKDKFKKAYHNFCADNIVEYCNFCKIFLTEENMQKFGCFFSKEFFCNYFKDTINQNFVYDSAKKENIKIIENIFYSKIEKSLIIKEDKKWKIEYIKEMNKNYLARFSSLRQFNKSINYYRFYQLSINEDLISEKEKLDNELEELDETIEEIKRERRERIENRRREREEREEDRKRERRERREKEEKEENRKREKREEREKRRPVYLLRCPYCADKCLFCGGKVSGSGRNKKYIKATFYFRAHGSCIPGNDIKKCAICHKNGASARCNNQCYNCFENRNKIEEKCFYCKESLTFWDK